jgi:uncharacterized OB-fold protein
MTDGHVKTVSENFLDEIRDALEQADYALGIIKLGAADMLGSHACDEMNKARDMIDAVLEDAALRRS